MKSSIGKTVRITLLLIFSVLLLPMFAVAGAGVGVVVVNVVVGIARSDFFIRWEKLDGISNFQKISEATSQVVWAQTDKGELYHWSSFCLRDPDCQSWLPTESVPSDLHVFGEVEIERASACSELEGPSLRDGQVECVYARYRGPEHGVDTYYALSTDGEIWRWTKAGQFHLGLMLILFSLPIGLVAGVVTYLKVVPKRVSNWIKNNKAVSPPPQ